MTRYEMEKSKENCTDHHEACECIQYKFQIALKEELESVVKYQYKTIDALKRNIQVILKDYFI